MGGVSVATWLASLPLTDPPTAVELQELRADLDHSVTTSCRAVRAHLDVDLLPARVPKSRLADLQRCERSALARFRDVAPVVAGDAVLRGTALDQFVAHQLTAGRVREPVADLTSMLSAAGDWSSLAVLDDMDLVEAAALLEPMAAAVAASWSGIDPAWAPRVECRASVVLADGACVCSVVDVELGGVTTDRPGCSSRSSGRAAVPSGRGLPVCYGGACDGRPGRRRSLVPRRGPDRAPRDARRARGRGTPPGRRRSAVVRAARR
jgi:hypothetical protein